MGDQVTTFGHHGAGQPAIDGKVVWIENYVVGIETTRLARVGRKTETVICRRSISNVRKVIS